MAQFINQEFRSIVIRITNSSVDLSLATETKILYVKPNGEEGEWEATKSGNDFIFNANEGEIDIAGVWKFQAYGKVNDLSFYSDIVEQMFENPLG